MPLSATTALRISGSTDSLRTRGRVLHRGLPCLAVVITATLAGCGSSGAKPGVAQGTPVSSTSIATTTQSTASATSSPASTGPKLAFPTGTFQRNVTDVPGANGVWVLGFDASGVTTAQAPTGVALTNPPGTYVVSGDKVTLRGANCPDAVYTWTFSGGSLAFQVVGADACNQGGRQMIFTDGPWTRG